jgi:hypothetical protein
MITQTILISVYFIFMLQSCSLTKQNSSSTCINDLIERMELNSNIKEIWQYQLQEDVVYYIKMNGADQYNKLLNSSCKLICHPDGGITGLGDGQCPDFFDSRTKGQLLWPLK